MHDYDCAHYDPVAFDIANHFNEMAANYHSDTPHLLDYSKYPGIFYYLYLMVHIFKNINFIFVKFYIYIYTLILFIFISIQLYIMYLV